MAEVDPGFNASEGTPEQLPRGAAQALNENTNVQAPDELVATPVADAPGEEEAEVEELDPEDEALLGNAAETDYAPIYEPATEDEQFILGPTMRPDESQTVGTEPQSPISPRTRRMVSVLQRAAEEPGASEELRLLVDYILRNA